MMPLPSYGLNVRRIVNDDSSQELRAYLRAEYGTDMGWLRAQVRPRSVPLTARLRQWFRIRSQAREIHGPVAGPTETILGPSGARAIEASTCSHLVAEDLGLGGNAEFLRCSSCGSVLVVREGRRWRIDAGEPTTGSEVHAALGVDPLSAPGWVSSPMEPTKP